MKAQLKLPVGRGGVDRRRALAGPVELFAVLDVQELLKEVPYSDAIVDAQTWRESRGENELAVGRPLTVRGVGCVDSRYLGQQVTVINIEIAEVTIDRG